MLASALALCGAGPSAASEVGSDGAPLNGMAPLYVHIGQGDSRAASATLTLPAEPANKGWYANWIMLVGYTPAVAHQMFVQIGLIRRPDQDSQLHVFIASQENDQHITYRQVGETSDAAHRFVIAQHNDVFSLLLDGKAVAAMNLPTLAHAPHAYVEIGPEVYTEGDSLSGSVLYAAIQDGGAWNRLRGADLCRYQNHGTILLRQGASWTASGTFDRKRPSTFLGSCAGI